MKQSSYSVSMRTLIEGLRWKAHYLPEQCAYTFLRHSANQATSLTYAQLDRHARAIAALLQQREAQDTPILLLLQPGLEYIAAFFGCLYAGTIAVPAYPPFSPRMVPRIQAILQDAGSRIILTTSNTVADIRRCFSALPNLQHLDWVNIDTIADGTENAWQEPDVTGDTIAFLQYTSGSTASPKGVMVSHSNLIHNLGFLREHCEQTSESHLVSWVPPYHDLGLIAGILLPFYVGCPSTLMSPVSFLQRPLRWLQTISDTRATMSIAPNFAYELCAQKITPEQRAELDLSTWEVAGNGGEPLRAETIERFSAAFAECGFQKKAFFPGYGLAESTLIIATGAKSKLTVVRTFQKTALEQHRAVPVSADDQDASAIIGYDRLIAGHNILVVSPETLTVCPTNQVGEIWVAGPTITRGYWQNPEETACIFEGYLQDTGEGPFLRTGDLGFMDAGDLFITGRLKDLIVIRGQNYYPQDIEYTTDTCHPAIRPGCSAAFPMDVNGTEQLVILAEIDPRYAPEGTEQTTVQRQRISAQAVVDTIRRAVAEQHELSVQQVVLLKAGGVYKTSSGKIQRRACRAAFLQNELSLWGK